MTFFKAISLKALIYFTIIEYAAVCNTIMYTSIFIYNLWKNLKNY